MIKIIKKLKNEVFIFTFLFIYVSCVDKKSSDIKKQIQKGGETIVKEYGYKLNDFNVFRDTIENGESFGVILDRYRVGYPTVYKIEKEIKDILDVKRLSAGKPYTVLTSKDSLEKAQVFIYQESKIDYVVVDFKDSIIKAKRGKKKVSIKVKEATGVIESSLSQAVDKAKLSPLISHELSSIYAWTIDFFRLQKGDKFKILFEEKYIDSTTYIGIGKIKAVYFEHKSKPFYAFRYTSDGLASGPAEYYDERAENLRKTFLKAPLKFSRISSRYNLKRRIAHYGHKTIPHRGTDFAAPVGTPIMSTADGVVVESTQKGGNGKYVKVKHNQTYSTQYLHMSRRAVKVGDLVKQGQIIGYVGMTGSTSGPHVCYRFWKNQKQVDPFKQKLPGAKALKKELRPAYYSYIENLKNHLDTLMLSTDSQDSTLDDVYIKSSDSKVIAMVI